MEIIWRLMDKVPDELKLPSKLLRLKHTPDGILLWRKAYYNIKQEIEEAEKLKEETKQIRK